MAPYEFCHNFLYCINSFAIKAISIKVRNRELHKQRAVYVSFFIPLKIFGNIFPLQQLMYDVVI